MLRITIMYHTLLHLAFVLFYLEHYWNFHTYKIGLRRDYTWVKEKTKQLWPPSSILYTCVHHNRFFNNISSQYSTAASALCNFKHISVHIIEGLHEAVKNNMCIFLNALVSDCNGICQNTKFKYHISRGCILSLPVVLPLLCSQIWCVKKK